MLKIKNPIRKQGGFALRNSKGFTLIEILVVIGIIAILATIVLIAINPARQFKQARDSQRVSNINAILNAIGQRIADNKGKFDGTYAGVPCPTLGATAKICKGATSCTGTTVDLSCLVPTYIASSIPFDPSNGSWTDPGNYDTGYTVTQDSTTGRVSVTATAELPSPSPISVTR